MLFRSVIAVSDDAVGSVAEQLPATEGLVVHTAGSVSMDIFAGKVQNYGVMYPLQTFSKDRPVDFREIPFFLEADSSENLQLLMQIAKSASNKVFAANSLERMRLHLAAVFGCNFVNCMYDIASQIAGQSGFDSGILAPVLMETAQKAIASGNPQLVQTGPARRNDANVMQKHAELLADRPDWQNIYEQLSRYIGRKNSIL